MLINIRGMDFFLIFLVTIIIYSFATFRLDVELNGHKVYLQTCLVTELSSARMQCRPCWVVVKRMRLP